MGIKKVLSARRSPSQRAYVERAIGTIRGECLDHLIAFNEQSLHRHIQEFLNLLSSQSPALVIDEGQSGAATGTTAAVRPNCLDSRARRRSSRLRTSSGLRSSLYLRRRLSNPAKTSSSFAQTN
jgi:hypothetical protein